MEDVYKEVVEQNEQKQSIDEQASIKQAASDMISVMMNDPDPKFQNSRFLNFLNKLNTGDYRIEDNQLIEDPTKSNQVIINGDAEIEQMMNTAY